MILNVPTVLMSHQTILPRLVLLVSASASASLASLVIARFPIRGESGNVPNIKYHKIAKTQKISSSCLTAWWIVYGVYGQVCERRGKVYIKYYVPSVYICIHRSKSTLQILIQSRKTKFEINSMCVNKCMYVYLYTRCLWQNPLCTWESIYTMICQRKIYTIIQALYKSSCGCDTI